MKVFFPPDVIDKFLNLVKPATKKGQSRVSSKPLILSTIMDSPWYRCGSPDYFRVISLLLARGTFPHQHFEDFEKNVVSNFEEIEKNFK